MFPRQGFFGPNLSPLPPIAVSARDKAVCLGPADNGFFINFFQNTFSQPITSAAELGGLWSCFVGNSGTGFVTLTPNGRETITVNGVAVTSWVLWPQETGLLFSNGSGLYYHCLHKGEIVQTIGSAVNSVSFATGLAYRRKMCLQWANIKMNADSQISLRVNSNVPDRTVNIYGAFGLAPSIGQTATDNFTMSTTAFAAGGIFGKADFSVNAAGTTAEVTNSMLYTASTQSYGHCVSNWSTTDTTITSITAQVAVNNFVSGTFILREL